ncbi:MAG: hypothetical protein HS116_15975 [Planctomycetes bacterium]|nr:hypothetical protein [Planctomycetota bacterium]
MRVQTLEMEHLWHKPESGLGSILRFASFSQDGTQIVALSNAGEVAIWSAQSGELLRRYRMQGEVQDVVESENGPLVLTLYAPNHKKPSLRQIEWTSRLNRLGGVQLADSSLDELIEVFINAFKSPPIRLTTQARTVLSYYENGITLDIDQVSLAQILDEATRLVALTWEVRDDGVWILTPGEKATQVEFERNAVPRVWNLATGSLVRELRGHVMSANCAKFSNQGAHVASSDGDGRVWDTQTGALLHVFKQCGSFDTACYSAQAQRLMVFKGTGYSDLTAWDLSTGDRVQEEWLDLSVERFFVSPDQHWVILNREDECQAIELKSKVWHPVPLRSSIRAKGISYEGRCWSSGISRAQGSCINLQTGELKWMEYGCDDWLETVFSRDGRRFLAVTYDGGLILDAHSGEMLIDLTEKVPTGGPINPFAHSLEIRYPPNASRFSADGSSFVIMRGSNVLEHWTRRRSERWWGAFELPECWILLCSAALFVRSIMRDRRSFRMLH